MTYAAANEATNNPSSRGYTTQQRSTTAPNLKSNIFVSKGSCLANYLQNVFI